MWIVPFRFGVYTNNTWDWHVVLGPYDAEKGILIQYRLSEEDISKYRIDGVDEILYYINNLNSTNIVGSYAEGAHTFSAGNGSHAEGIEALALGDRSHAEGSRTRALGQGSHAEGLYTFTSEQATFAHAEGGLTQALNGRAHAEGDSTTASGVAAHAEGCLT